MDEQATLKAAMTTLALLTQELESKSTSIERLRRMLFGAKTEKTSEVFGEPETRPGHSKKEPRPKQPGHGRNGATAYAGATHVKVPHASISTGDRCSSCAKGRVYPFAESAPLVRITAMAPITGFVYDRDRYRCNGCGEVFTAAPPEGVGPEKYDESVIAMLGLLKYGTGLPFHRIEKLQDGFGVPMPASTQWELVAKGAELLEPAFEELIRQGAQGDVLYNDDTTMKVLNITKAQRAAAAAANADEERTGIFTSGIISTKEKREIALFFTGVKHAGENISDVLSRRSADLPPPIQMCDGLSRNTTGEFETILSNCNAHSRRKYVEVAEWFPDECRYVLEQIRDVYKNDAIARERKLSAQDRLEFHQVHSGPLMGELQKWMSQQIDEHRVEPNSGLGDAILYMQEHWTKLTLFLREPGAPLDNNICERLLKKAILHRKNALFYRTLNGARVGDIFMSFIHSAELNDVQPHDYLVALLCHHEAVRADPAAWMPWNYKAAVEKLKDETAPKSQ